MEKDSSDTLAIEPSTDAEPSHFPAPVGSEAWSLGRADQRQKMEEWVSQLATHWGVENHRRKRFAGPVAVELLVGGELQVAVEFEPRNKPQSFLLSWHMRLRSEFQLKPYTFTSINATYYHKATSYCEGLDALGQELERVFRLARKGELLTPAPKR